LEGAGEWNGEEFFAVRAVGAGKRGRRLKWVGDKM